MREETVELRRVFFQLLEDTLTSCNSGTCNRPRPHAHFYFGVCIRLHTLSLLGRLCCLIVLSVLVGTVLFRQLYTPLACVCPEADGL